MIFNDRVINQMINGDVLQLIAESRGVDIAQARHILSKMSFLEHMRLRENITPPSGQKIGAQTAANKQPTNGTTASSAGNKPDAKVWGNPNAPITPGMTVGVNSDNGVITPMQVSQVDQNASGVKVKDPTTGKETWYNKEQLVTMGVNEADDQDDEQLGRILELAGIKEMSSAGATSAGAIAAAPAPVGKTRRRTEETALRSEHTRKTPYETVIGDTKPAQASGQLSANLAASGKPTANRKPRR